jgi:hypothetical protein
VRREPGQDLVTSLFKVAFLFLGWLLPVCVAGQEPPPVSVPLQVHPPELDLGEQAAGQWITLEFEISNRDANPVRLRYIHTECDCTLTVPDSGWVPADGRWLLVAQLNLEDRKPGPLEELITILTDNSDQPELSIPVRALITQNP